MPNYAATHILPAATHGHNLAGVITVAVIVLLITTAGYLLLCWLSPFTTCHHPQPHRAWRCRHCDGTGQRLRAGRHLLNRLRDLHRH